jgi:hypothetical protein
VVIIAERGGIEAAVSPPYPKMPVQRWLRHSRGSDESLVGMTARNLFLEVFTIDSESSL